MGLIILAFLPFEENVLTDTAFGPTIHVVLGA
jgi:hypothetical protein